MKILISGATGFIGQELALELVRQGHHLRIFSREPEKHQGLLGFPAELFAWDPDQGLPPSSAFEGVEAVIHLAGESIASGRWNRARKKRILDSRVKGTQNLVEAIQKYGTQVQTFIAASAVGIYGDRGDEVLDEASPGGKGSLHEEAPAVEFLAGVCQQWESAATHQLPVGVRSVIVRIGIVLGSNAGALGQMLPIFRSGLGGRLGSGQQWMSWIHVQDLVRIFNFALTHSEVSGVLNGVAPHPVRNAEFTRELSQSIHRPAFLRTPRRALQLVLGGVAQAILSSQRVLPKRLLQSGFSFEYPVLKEALKSLIPSDVDELLVKRQWIPASLDRVFEFFSSAHNLEKITPPWLQFKVLTPLKEGIQEGSLIDYRLKIHGLPVHWQTLIESWNPRKSFVDTQLKGPYSKWHHTHLFEELQGGVLIEDRVLYRVPMAFVGRFLAGAWVRRDVETIFNYRKKVIREIFSQ